MLKRCLPMMILALFVFPAFTTTAQARNKADDVYMKKAAQSDRFHIELGKLIRSNSSNPQVQDLGRTMIDDHTKSLRSLQDISRDKRLNIPGNISNEQRRTLDLFSRLRGDRFDIAVVSFLVSDHMKAITDAEDVIALGDSGEVKSKANSDLSVLEHHLDMSTRLLEEMGGGAGSRDFLPRRDYETDRDRDRDFNIRIR